MQMAGQYSAKEPYLSNITENTLLNGPGASKETRHFVFNLPKSGMEYKVGDALGVFAENPPHSVEQLLQVTGWDGNDLVTGPSGEAPLREVLQTQVEIHRVNKKFIQSLADKISPLAGMVKSRISKRVRIVVGESNEAEWQWDGESGNWPEGYAPGSAGGDPSSIVANLVKDADAMENYIWSRDYIDVIGEFGLLHELGEFLSLCDKLKPRLYSIASSMDVHPGEVQLTVGIVRYDYHGRSRGGLCTVYLADAVEVNNTPIKVFMSPTKSFILPSDTSKDIIMVGPGTGIAPFRAFLEQREFDGGEGRNWLFFGDQSEKTEFYYKEQIETWLDNGTLYKFTSAWSRDQPEKIYVQNRMAENGEQLWQWIDNGAYFYICGDKNRMAKDVHNTLIQIAQEHGGLSEIDATEFIEKTLMRAEKRYLRDVY
jgi:sulfite reductase (NADPH) flavoprotein alpha-component